MTEIKFSNLKNLKEWLLSASGVALVSVSLISDVKNLDIQFKSAKILSTIIESEPSFFPDGEYLIKFTNSNNLEAEEIDYSKMIMVISLEARLLRSGEVFGGLTPLLSALSDYEYSCTIDRTNSAYVTAGIWVIEPQEPDNLRKLKNILQKHAIFYAFNDGSGLVTVNNANFGNGIHS